MHAKTEMIHALRPPELSQAEVVDAAFSTLEMLLPHAARVVEEKTQALVEQISALVSAARAQESTIAQLVACVQHRRVAEHDISLDTLLNRTQVSLTFSLEHNLEFTRYAQGWVEALDANIATLQRMEAPLLQKQGLEAMAATVRQAGRHLEQLRLEIRNTGMDARERELYRNDMRAVTEILQEQPVRARQLQSLLEDANSSARAIAEHGRAAVMAIQFQDYNSQLAENAVRLLRILRQSVCAHEAAQDGEDLLTTCRDALSMGEIRHMFTQNLKQHPDIDRGYLDLAQGAVELF